MAILVALLGLGSIAQSAQATDRSMRCGTHRVYAGGGPDATPMFEVLKKCGEPQQKLLGQWIYDQGKMRRVLSFGPDGRVHSIESYRN